MKKIISLLLIVCSITTAVNAVESSAPAKQPETLKSAIQNLFDVCGDKNSVSNHIVYNPDTGILEEAYVSMSIKCGRNSETMLATIDAFEQDKDCGYMYLHLRPFEMKNFQITTNSGTITPRTVISQEMWVLNVKNADNPRLRDNYTLVFDSKQNTGTIYMVTSTRPDLMKKSEPVQATVSYPNADKNRKFVINGTVDEAISDSCYNIYIDDNLVACVPVINKKFQFETELDTMKDGIIRALFPGNKLCSAWISIKFVPGLTIDMSVHNGYYNIANEGEYNAKVNEYRTKAYTDAAEVQSDVQFADAPELQRRLQVYNNMLMMIKVQMEDIISEKRPVPSIRYKVLKSLYKQRLKVLKKMKKDMQEYIDNELT